MPFTLAWRTFPNACLLYKKPISNQPIGFSIPQIKARDVIARQKGYASLARPSLLSISFPAGTPLLQRLDNIMKRFRSSAPAFYKGYLAARTIVDR